MAQESKDTRTQSTCKTLFRKARIPRHEYLCMCCSFQLLLSISPFSTGSHTCERFNNPCANALQADELRWETGKYYPGTSSITVDQVSFSRNPHILRWFYGRKSCDVIRGKSVFSIPRRKAKSPPTIEKRCLTIRHECKLWFSNSRFCLERRPNE